ncbi:helix-turn-helix domain-containing protein [Robertkochia solimangrovi]|uniref:helix-turn-helix domain-containing protein n=1 Tax=Robertkochia solimangrovi TaxID=2213046 RepID=UPI00117C8BE1|nr:AraC family transcriptional regulator [Robertkochia solimangrovi]TRZ41623.1 AraC family transcriptional regulator [Robertkochia solimangrovi]
MSKEYEYRNKKPDSRLADLVESFWMLRLPTDHDKEIVVLPDGRIDLFFTISATQTFHITLSGLETHADQVTLEAGTLMFAISFKLLATEYILENTVSNILDYAKYLPDDYWGFEEADLDDFDLFCSKAEARLLTLLPSEIDPRKQKLFENIYSSDGALTVQELSEKAFWSSRQINRYFNKQFGISLKSYCNILRFRASFHHIREGKLFPSENFTDQSHFIREVKKLSGVSPKELSKNKNDRFIQFSFSDPE